MTRFFDYFNNFFKNTPTFFLLSLLSGVLTGTSYIPFNGWALFFCYLPLWVAALNLHHENSSLKQIFFAGWITQFVLTLIGFNWIFYLASEFGHLPWALSLGALLLFAAVMHLYIPLSLVLGVWVVRKFRIKSNYVQFILMALFLALLERIWPSIFEWNMAYTLLWIKFPLYQWADSVGFWGLSTWLMIFQANLAYAFWQYKTNKWRSLTTTTATLVLIALLSVTGFSKGKAWATTDETVKIAVAQGNIGNAEKVLSEKKYQYHSYIRSIYTDLTSKHLAQHPTDIMIWPETAMPFGLDEHFHERLEQKSLIDSVQSWGIPVVTGAYSVDLKKQDHLGNPIYRNGIFYLSPSPGFLSNFTPNFSDKPYFKTNLLVFGEYMPFGEQFPILYQLLPFVGTYERGSGPVVANVVYNASGQEKTLRMGPQVCYDSLYPDFSRGLASNGAQVIFNVTNDSWYGWWSEPYQHQIMTLARGIEVRRPLIRSTNTGVSSAILADGTLLENSPVDKTWVHTYNIPYRSNPTQTFYTQIGYLDWVLWLLLLIALVFVYRGKDDHVRN